MNDSIGLDDRKSGAGIISAVPALGFEAVLWKAAEKLRNSMDPSESMQVVLGLIFLKYISDQENGTTIKAREGRSCAF